MFKTVSLIFCLEFDSDDETELALNGIGDKLRGDRLTGVDDYIKFLEI